MTRSNILRQRLRGGAVGLGVLLAGGGALAQTNPPRTIPELDGFSLPAARPTVVPTPEPTTRPPDVESPSATPVPVATPTPRPTPTPRATPAPRRASLSPTPAVPRPLRTPLAQAPVAAPSLTPLPSPQRARQAPPVALSGHGTAASSMVLPWAAGAGVLALLALGYAWRQRRDRRRTEDNERSGDIAAVDTGPAPAGPVPPPPSPLRALLEVEFMPTRAGTNVLSASVEYRLTVRNAGTIAATAIRLDLRLFGAGPSQQAVLAALAAGPIDRPATAPFDLAPGAVVTLDGMAMHPKETLDVLAEALGADAPAVFVPVLSVRLRYDWVGGTGQLARAFAVGLVRGGAKLQPFRRDDARMYDRVAALAVA